MDIEQQYRQYCDRMANYKEKPNQNDSSTSSSIPIPFHEFKKAMAETNKGSK